MQRGAGNPAFRKSTDQDQACGMDRLTMLKDDRRSIWIFCHVPALLSLRDTMQIQFTPLNRG
jgi:hypothetical protein